MACAVAPALTAGRTVIALKVTSELIKGRLRVCSWKAQQFGWKARLLC
jgi:hypothetical protein